MAFRSVWLLDLEFNTVRRTLFGHDTYRLFPVIEETNGLFWLKDVGWI